MFDPNSKLMYIMVAVIILYVAAQAVFFLLKAVKRAKELNPATLFLFSLLASLQKIKLINYWPRPSEISPSDIEGEVLLKINEKEFRAKASGHGPISAFVEAVNSIDEIPSFTLQEYEEETMGQSADATGICFVRIKNENIPCFGYFYLL